MPLLNTFPGVYFEVVDQSTYTSGPGVNTSVGIFADTIKGPANEWVKVENWGQFQALFGGLGSSRYGSLYYGPQAAKTILSETDELWVYRMLDNSDVAAITPARTQEPSSNCGFKLRLVTSGAGNFADATNRPCYIFEASLVQDNTLYTNKGLPLYDIYLYESDQYHLNGASSTPTPSNGMTFNGYAINSPDASSLKAKEYYKRVSFLKDPTDGIAAIDALGLHGGDRNSNIAVIEITHSGNWNKFNSNSGLTPPSGLIGSATPYSIKYSNEGSNLSKWAFSGGSGARMEGAARDLNGVDHPDVKTLEDGLDLFIMPDAHLADAAANAEVLTAWEYMIDVATDYGGLFIFSTQDASSTTTLLGAQNAQAYNTSHGAIYTPWLKTLNPDEGAVVTYPCDAWIVKSCLLTDRINWPWFAPAGGVRGSLSNVSLAKTFSEAKMEDLYNGNVNVLRTIPQVGHVIWGQKTTQKKKTALDRVNVRRLLTYLRKKVKEIAAAYLFEPNDAATWSRMKTQIDALMAVVKTERGVYDFRTIIDETTNTAEVIDRNELRGKIFLKPTKTAEVITMSFIIAGTGANFDE
jgi:hypothetical protein